MLKRILVLGVLLFFVSNAFANVEVIFENSKERIQNNTFEWGEAQRGETLTLTISSDPKIENIKSNWDNLVVLKDTLPDGWKFENSKNSGKVLSAKIFIPIDAMENEIYYFKVKAINESNAIPAETINVQVKLKQNLLETGISQTLQVIPVNNSVDYSLQAVNNSIGEHTIIVKSNLPLAWFNEKKVTIKSGEVKKVNLEIVPRVYGVKNFEFFVYSKEQNKLIKIIPVSLDVQPTLQDKYAAALYGFPFFTISLVPYYVLNGLFSIAFP